jgi:cytochrome c oxidase subunit 2
MPETEAGRGPDRRRRRAAVLTGLLVSALGAGGAVLGVVVLGRAGLPRRATEQGETVVDVWRFMLGLAGAVAGVVLAFLVVAFIQAWRDRHDPEPEQVTGDVRAELVYTGIPLAIVAIVFVVSLRASDAVDAAPERDAVVVEVTAFQWGWRFAYDDGPTVVGASPDTPELVLPVDETVVLDLRSEDVIHSFFVPAFLTKLDVVPGRENRLSVVPSAEGTYDGHCAEFCGLDHARMNFTVRIVSADEFQAWLDEQAEAA